MTVTWTLLAILVVQSCQSQPPATPLSPQHRATIQAETLAPVLRVTDLPLSVREALRSEFEQPVLEMADPPAPSRRFALPPWTPVRRLISAGCGQDHCLVHYEERSYGQFYWVVIFGLNREDAQVEWSGLVPQPINEPPELKAVVLRRATASER